MRTLAVCLLLLAPLLGSAAVHERVGFSPEPDWIIASEFASTNFPALGSGEVLTLVDQQVNLATGQQFYRIARKILNQSRLQDASRISLTFDPTFSRFDLHRLDVRRGAELTSRLKPDRIEILQREKNLERDLYDGSLSVLAMLDDIRIGDQIEYSYTISGTNPVFRGIFCDTADLGSDLGVLNYRYRLLCPSSRTIQYQVTDDRFPDWQPVVRDLPGAREYVWTRRDLPPIHLEPLTPLWYNPYTTLRLSEFKTWADVADWAAATFTPPAGLSDELEAQLKTWSALPDPEQRLIEALQFVQDQVRYLGIEVGASSHRPSDPSTVFSRRFGDCKDKTVLLCAIFNRLGVEATPALVNAYGGVDTWHPSPLAFNHVIARVKRGAQELWLDPTLMYQRGALNERSCPEYGQALLARAGVTALCTVRPSPKAPSKLTVRETVELGTNALADLTVVTTYHGAHAEHFRALLAEVSVDQITKSKRAVYSKEFPLIETRKPIEINDRGNHIRTTESYTIHNPWKKTDTFRINFEMDCARTIARNLYMPEAERRMPVGILSHPLHIHHTTTVWLPERSRIKDEQEFIAGPADELKFKQVNEGYTIAMEFEYRTRTNTVPVDQMTHHIRALDRMRQHMFLSISWVPGTSSDITYLKRPRGPLLWASAGFAGFMFVLFRFLKSRRNCDDCSD